MSAQAVSLGDELLAVTDKHSFDNFNMTEEFRRKVKKSSKSSLQLKAGENEEKEELKDIHFFFRSSSPTAACPNGRSTIITMRCDVDDKSLKGCFITAVFCPISVIFGVVNHFRNDVVSHVRTFISHSVGLSFCQSVRPSVPVNFFHQN